MANFIELTQESGVKITINTDTIVTFVALGGDPLRGTAITFGFTAGDKNAAKMIRVAETYSQVAAVMKPARGR